MITFDSAAPFLEALKRLNFPASNLTPSSANAHIMLEQHTSSQMQLTAYGKDGSWMRQSIQSTSTQEGIKHLILAADVPAIQKKIKAKYALQIQDDNGALAFSTFNGYSEGVANVQDTILVQQYHGAIEDFGPPVFLESTEEEPLPTIYFDETQFVQALLYIKDFAEFTKSKEQKGFLVVVQPDGKAHFYVSAFEPNYFLHLSLTCETTVEEELSFILRGDHIDMVSNALVVQQAKKGKSAEAVPTAQTKLVIKQVEGMLDQITIYGSNGTVTTPGLDLDKFIALVKSRQVFEPDDRKEVTSYRTFKIERMQEALEAQAPDKDSNGKRIKIEAIGVNLVITKLADFRRREYSNVVTEDTDEALTTDFPTLTYSANGLLKIMSVLSAIRAKHTSPLDKQNTPSDLVVGRTVRLQGGKREKWLVQFSLSDSPAQGSYDLVAMVTPPREGDVQ